MAFISFGLKGVLEPTRRPLFQAVLGFFMDREGDELVSLFEKAMVF
jgi:hypothetical protein